MTAFAAFSVAAASTADLVAFFNEYAAEAGVKPVARFADRKTAERRVNAMIESLRADEPAADAAEAAASAAAIAAITKAATKPAAFDGACPSCGAARDCGDITTGRIVERNGAQDEVDLHIDLCHRCGTSFNNETGKPAKFSNERAKGNSSAAISASWADPEVRAARLQRTSVEVFDSTGALVLSAKSMAAACRALRIRFTNKARLDLKAAGSLVVEGFRFVADTK